MHGVEERLLNISISGVLEVEPMHRCSQNHEDCIVELPVDYAWLCLLGVVLLPLNYKSRTFHSAADRKSVV